jgi:hypothetical protein
MDFLVTERRIYVERLRGQSGCCINIYVEGRWVRFIHGKYISPYMSPEAYLYVAQMEKCRDVLYHVSGTARRSTALEIRINGCLRLKVRFLVDGVTDQKLQ